MSLLLNISEIATIVLSFFALIVSIISICFSVKYSNLQIKHNENSVRPISSIVLNDYENKIAVIVKNAGTGPLIIRKFIAKNPKREEKSLIKLMPNINQAWNTFIEDLENRAICVGDELILIELKPETSYVKNIVREILADITIYLEYEDIYGNRFKDSKELVFFGRHKNAIKK